jgi:hypothetical protein
MGYGKAVVPVFIVRITRIERITRILFTQMDKRISKAIFLVAFVLLAQASFSQTKGVGSWNVLSGMFTLDSRWKLFAEAQIRSQQFYSDFNYYEAKGGIGYSFKTNGWVLLGMGHYNTFQPTGDFVTPNTTEFRIWQQLVLNNNINRLKLEHRYRVEQRFISTGYRNRFRYRINALFPFNNTTIKKKTLYASAYNEIFVSNEGPFFEQNRIFGGLGYQFDDHFTILTGIVNRFDNSISNVQTSKNFFQINFLFSLGEARSGKERHPSTMD